MFSYFRHIDVFRYSPNYCLYRAKVIQCDNNGGARLETEDVRTFQETSLLTRNNTD